MKIILRLNVKYLAEIDGNKYNFSCIFDSMWEIDGNYSLIRCGKFNRKKLKFSLHSIWQIDLKIIYIFNVRDRAEMHGNYF